MLEPLCLIFLLKMKIFEYAIITNVIFSGENNAVVKFFGECHGALTGFVKRIKVKNKATIFEKGNVLKISYFQREGTMATMTGESYALYMHSCMHDHKNMKLILAICECLNICFHGGEQNNHEKIFENIIYYLEGIKKGLCFEENIFNLTILIKNILGFCGYAFRLEQCVVTAIKDIDQLVFLSPKSASAVCEQAGQQYYNLMLRLPRCFITNNYLDVENNKDLVDCIKIISFFIDKNFNKILNEIIWLKEKILLAI